MAGCAAVIQPILIEPMLSVHFDISACLTVSDFAKAWNTLLNHYLKVLEALKNVLLTENTVNQGYSDGDANRDFIPNQV